MPAKLALWRFYITRISFWRQFSWSLVTTRNRCSTSQRFSNRLDVGRGGKRLERFQPPDLSQCCRDRLQVGDQRARFIANRIHCDLYQSASRFSAALAIHQRQAIILTSKFSVLNIFAPKNTHRKRTLYRSIFIWLRAVASDKRSWGLVSSKF